MILIACLNKRNGLMMNVEVKRKAIKKLFYNLTQTEALKINKFCTVGKKDYKYCCKITKNKYLKNLSLKMGEMKNKNQKDFWNMFKTKNSDNGESINIKYFIIILKC